MKHGLGWLMRTKSNSLQWQYMCVDSYTWSVVSFTEDILPISYSVGLVPTKQNLSLTEKVTASSFCR